MKVLLASKSSRRRKLIKSITDDVLFTESGADETLPRINLTPAEAAMFLAEKKALKSLQTHKATLEDDRVIIGSDTVVTLDFELFGKPKDKQDAYNTLKKLSGRTHSVVTAVCILDKSFKHDAFFDKTDVTFNELTDEMIWDYINTGDPFDKAGSYGIQNLPKSFIKSVDGDLNNVIGLPTEKLKEHLDNFEDLLVTRKSKQKISPLEDLLYLIVQGIKPVDNSYKKKAKDYLLTKAMPSWALGKLLDLGVDLVGITQDLHPDTSKKTIFVLAGDHGIVEENVSAYPQEVTLQMFQNILEGKAGINVLAKQSGTEIVLIDMGIIESDDDISGLMRPQYQKLKKIDKGTKNFHKAPAMTRTQALDAIISAYNMASNKIAKDGDQVVGIGELGIGNTSSATAIISVLGDLPVELVTGRGTGLDDEGLNHKVQIIKESIALNKPNPEDPLDVLTKLGGFEIAGMVGVILAAASRKVPIVIDGFVTAAAALIAYKLDPKLGDFMIASHKSVEPGHIFVWNILNKEPLLDLNLRLGEGTGAAVAMNLIDSASAILNDMTTFEEGNVSNKNG